MKINNFWRSFGIQYAILTILMLLHSSLNSYTLYLVKNNLPIPWNVIRWELFTGGEAPFMNALWPSLLGSIFYHFIFKNLTIKNYKLFYLQFVFFIIGMCFLNIFNTTLRSWLWSNFEYIHTVAPTPQELEKEGQLFKPFISILTFEFKVFFNLSNWSQFFIYKFILINTIYSLLFAFFMYFIESKKREEKLLALQRETEIKALQGQLNPHFLFNSLNTIYSTAIVEKDTKTASLVQQLSGIMRHSVEESKNEFTDIQKEITFLEKYIALQKARLPENKNIVVESAIEWDQEPTQIAPLMLICFVENAFQYGISIDEPSFIKINVSVIDQKLSLKIENSISGNINQKNGMGTGIENTKKRLELMYPSNYNLEYGSNTSSYKVSLDINLKK